MSSPPTSPLERDGRLALSEINCRLSFLTAETHESGHRSGKNRKQISSALLRSYLPSVPRTALGVNRSGFECCGGNPRSNKTKWGCIDALSCFI